MKKVLRFIGVLLLIIIAGVAILGLIVSKDVRIVRKVTVNAPADVVARQMLQFGNYNTWNPWASVDPEMKSEVTGEDGKAGSKYSWSGNGKVGTGEMVADAVTKDEMKWTLHFKKPFESTATGAWRVKEAGPGQSVASWEFNTHMAYPMNGIARLMGMTRGLRRNFDEGLAKLKAQAEAAPKETPALAGAYQIEAIQFPGHNYAAIRKTLSLNMEIVMKFFKEGYDALRKSAGNRISGPSAGFFYTWDQQAGTTDLAIAMPVSGKEPVKGATMINLPPSRAFMIAHKGGYGTVAKAHESLMEFLATKKETQTMIVEEYVKGPHEEKDSTKWETNIIYLVK